MTFHATLTAAGLAAVLTAAPASAATLKVTPVRTATPASTASAPAEQQVALLRLSGTAPAGRLIRASAGCPGRSCQTYTVTQATGRWQLTLPVFARATAKKVRVAITAPQLGERSVVERRLRTQRATPSTTRRAARPVLTVVGDSLAQGTRQLLAEQLAGRFEVRTDARRGRPLAEGLGVLGALPAFGPGDVLAVSLFTNDDPRAVPQLEQAVRASVDRVGPGGCAVWATIARPPLAKVSYGAANDRLRALVADPAFGGRLQLVDWHAMVAADRELVIADRVHATWAGYQARAAAYVEAIGRCGTVPVPPAGDPATGGVAPARR